MLIRIGYEMTVACDAPTPLVCLLSVHPDRAVDLEAKERFRTNPPLQTETYLDGFGNLCRRMVAPAGETVLMSDALIRDSGLHEPVVPDAREMPVEALPSDTLQFLLGSRYCETDLLSQTAWNLFGGTPRGWARVQAIVDFVHGHLTFGYGNARSTRTALQAYQEKVGVCRDFAHLTIAFCRAMNIPARYVNGYLGDIGVPALPDPMDFSAWVEVWLEGPEGGRWYTFDARHNEPRIGRVVIARGRDATDVPLINTFGPHRLAGFKVWTDEVRDQSVNAA